MIVVTGVIESSARWPTTGLADMIMPSGFAPLDYVSVDEEGARKIWLKMRCLR